MITSLEGKIVFRGDRFLVLEVGGVGYKVFVGPETLRTIPRGDEPVKIFTALHQRDEGPSLYGFLSYAELNLFEMLNNVSGVGPRTALAVIGVASVDMLKKAIAAGETNYLTKVSGIGRKTAEKIILELREKMGKTMAGDEFRNEEDALEALASLGYSLREARDALAKVAPDIAGAKDRIKAALSILGR